MKSVPRRPLRLFWLELSCCWRRGGQWMARRWWMLALATLAVLGLAWALHVGLDREWSRMIRLEDDSPVRPWSQRIGFWGDFAQYNLAVVGLLWVVGVIRAHSRWRRAAVSAFLAAVLAGVICNEFRVSVGRPRPQAERVDQAAGPTSSSSFHGFPSGHTAVAFGTSTPVLVLCPPVGVVLTVISSAVAWARMADGVHYPSDVLVGAWIGIAFGLACGFGMRRRNRRGRKFPRAGWW